jgi:hypothetical protein
MTTATTVYTVPGYPKVELTEDGEQITIRPMQQQDEKALLGSLRLPF